MINQVGRVPPRHKRWHDLVRGPIHGVMRESGAEDLQLEWPEGFATWSAPSKGDFWWQVTLTPLSGPEAGTVDVSGWAAVKTSSVDDLLLSLGLPKRDVEYSTIIVVTLPWLLRKLNVDASLFGWVMHEPPNTSELDPFRDHFCQYVSPFMRALCDIDAAILYLENVREFASAPKGGRLGGDAVNLIQSVLNYLRGEVEIARRKLDAHERHTILEANKYPNHPASHQMLGRLERTVAALRKRYSA
jgi:hypothetical protein